MPAHSDYGREFAERITEIILRYILYFISLTAVFRQNLRPKGSISTDTSMAIGKGHINT